MIGRRGADTGYNFNKSIKVRSSIVGLLFIFFFILFGVKSFQLQVSASDPKIKRLFDRQSKSKIKLTPQRAEIFDKNHKELAISIKMDSIYVHPHKVNNKEQIASFLSSVLDLNYSKIFKKLKSKRRFIWIKRLIGPEAAKKIKAKNIPGINFIKESKRFYPNKYLAAQAIGFVGYDSKGLEGLELKYNSTLMGKKVLYTVKTDAHRRPILTLVNNKNDPRSSAEHLFTNFISRDNIVLTIDKDLQYWTERELEKAVLNTDAPRGEAIIMDPNSGKILAIANYPYFNPNNFSKFPTHTYKNRTITDMFDPGSTFKLITSAIAIDMGKVTSKTIIDCENGAYTVGRRKKIREAMYKKFGKITVQEIIQHSSNIGTVKIAEKLDTKAYYEHIMKFGFNKRSGIDLPGESPGRIRHFSAWNEVDKANVSFGQGISVTSIQLINSIATIVNGGTLYKPYIVDRIVDKNGKILRTNQPVKIRENVIKPETVKTMKELMQSVVHVNGTAKNAIIPGINIGGKTGTAQKFDFKNYKYYNSRYVSSFVGAFPLENPKYIIFIKIDDPLKNKYASTSAVPPFKQLALHLIGKLDRESKIQTAKAVEPTKHPTNPISSFKPTKIIKLKSKIISKQELIQIPHLKKLSLREALKVFNDMNFDYEIIGSGQVSTVEPPPGTFVAKDSKVKIILK